MAMVAQMVKEHLGKYSFSLEQYNADPAILLHSSARHHALEPLPGEEIAIGEALGRVTAAAVFARVSVPHYHASAMDGIAVRAEDNLLLIRGAVPGSRNGTVIVRRRIERKR